MILLVVWIVRLEETGSFVDVVATILSMIFMNAQSPRFVSV